VNSPAPTGVMPLRDGGGRVDFSRMRVDRRARLRAAMDRHGVDVLLLGRPANIAYASGARLLWTAGHRPFSPACVVVRATGKVHLLSTWDEGVPDEIGHEDLFGLTWNPATAAANLRSITGVAPGAVVASDGWSPGAAGLIAAAFPGVEVVDGAPVLREARRSKTADEMSCIATAVALAEAALAAMAAGLREGASSRDLTAIHQSVVASLGSPCPPSEAVAWTAPAGGPGTRLISDRPFEVGERVVLAPGASFGGYEGQLARTFSVPAAGGSDNGSDDPATPEGPHAAAHLALLEACRPGATGADLLAAWRDTGGGPAPAVLARGCGLGAEAPVVGAGRGLDEVLVEGMALVVGGWSPPGEGRPGATFREDTVLVGPGGPVVLSRYGPYGTATRPDGKGTR